MSGIAGIVRFDDRPVRRQELERVANALHQYGPDKDGVIAQDNVGLVHALMRMTPEDRYDHQPTRGAGGTMITADLRIDNRDDLLRRLSLNRQLVAEWSDARLLLFAWEKAGDRIFSMLRGPFAVAIWDGSKRSLTLARDHLGLNVLMWHLDKNYFAFATMPNGLFSFYYVQR